MLEVGEEAIETAWEKAQMSDLTDKDFEAVVINTTWVCVYRTL